MAGLFHLNTPFTWETKFKITSSCNFKINIYQAYGSIIGAVRNWWDLPWLNSFILLKEKGVRTLISVEKCLMDQDDLLNIPFVFLWIYVFATWKKKYIQTFYNRKYILIISVLIYILENFKAEQIPWKYFDHLGLYMTFLLTLIDKIEFWCSNLFQRSSFLYSQGRELERRQE